MAKCIDCGAYAKFEGGLCTACFVKKNRTEKKQQEEFDDFDFAPAGLSDRERNYRYGMENTIPGIMELLRGVRSDVAQEIRRMPDFVMQNPKTKDVYFIEVKFRASGEFRFENLPKNYPYENAYFILVSKKHIKCITYRELQEGKEITPTSHNYLGYRKEFDLDKEVIIDFCNFAIQFFENV